MKFYIINRDTNEIVNEGPCYFRARDILNEIEDMDEENDRYEEGRYIITDENKKEVNFYTVDDIYRYYTGLYPGVNEYLLNWNDAAIRNIKWNNKGDDVLREYEIWIIKNAEAFNENSKEGE